MMKMLKAEKKHSDSALTNSFYTVQQKSNTKITIQKFTTPPCLPWNGWYHDVEFKNTCTIDNMLYCFHLLQTESHEFCCFMKESDNMVDQVLYSIHECFKQKKWIEGKCLWVQRILSLPVQDSVDLLGGEDEFFFNHISTGQATAYKSVCSDPLCPEKVSLRINRLLGFSERSETITSFQRAVTDWMVNTKFQPCQKGTCRGTRKHHPRHFLTGSVPKYFGIEMSLCPWAADMPLTITILDNLYQLKAATYGNGHHFNSSLSFKSRWYSYDGLKEHHSPGTGMKRIPMPQIPARYHPDYCLYVLK